MENGEDAGVGEGLFARASRDDVLAEVGGVFNEEAIDEPGSAAFEEIDCGAGDLGAIVPEDAVAQDD